MPTAHVNVKGRTSMDGSGWAAGLRKMETGTKGAASRMAGSFAGAIGGVFAVGFLSSATRRIVQHADQIQKTAKRISASTETVQKFDFAATQSGTNLESVQDAFMDLAKAIQEAKDGAETKRKALLDFGVTMQMLRTARPEEVFLKIAEAIEKAGGAMDKAKSLEELMGGGGRKLVPAFVSGFGSLMGQAPKGIDNATIESLVKFNDEMDRLKREVLPAAADAVAGLANVLEDIIKKPSGERRSAEDRNLLLVSKALNMAQPINWAGGVRVRGKTSGNSAARQNFTSGAMGLDEAIGPQEAGADYYAAAADMWVKAQLSKTSGQRMKDGRLQPYGADADAAAAAATGWSKPSLQLNSLQRIGAAVSQSADPVAIEKDNNQLLKNIAKHTKKTADNITSDEY